MKKEKEKKQKTGKCRVFGENKEKDERKRNDEQNERNEARRIGGN